MLFMLLVPFGGCQWVLDCLPHTARQPVAMPTAAGGHASRPARPEGRGGGACAGRTHRTPMGRPVKIFNQKDVYGY